MGQVSISVDAKADQMESDAYPLLGELASTLVLGVAEQLNDTLLVGGEAILDPCCQYVF